MEISIIVAAASDNAIGSNGDLIWHISADLKRFKALTMGHPIVMGRKTWQSLPNGALPGRKNIVITRDQNFTAENAVVCHSIQDAIDSCSDDKHIFIIGGAQIYNQALHLADRIYLTRVFAEYPDADARFPEINPNEWTIDSQLPIETTKSGLNYQFIDLIRNK